MLVQYTVLLLLNAARGCLAEIELAQSEVPASGARHWLWIESNTVTSLQLFDGAQGQLDWPGGRCDYLSVGATRALRPEFQRLLHQHLN